MPSVTRRTANIEAIKGRLTALKNVKLKAGYFGQKYPNGLTLAANAFIQEYGIRKGGKIINPRPTFEPAVKANIGNYNSLISSLSGADADQLAAIFGSIGALTVGSIKSNIAALTDPPLAESTIKAKMRARVAQVVGNLDKPLVDNRILIGASTFEVEQ